MFTNKSVWNYIIISTFLTPIADNWFPYICMNSNFLSFSDKRIWEMKLINESFHLLLILTKFKYCDISNMRIDYWTIIPLKILITPWLVKLFVAKFSSYMNWLRSNISLIISMICYEILQRYNHPLACYWPILGFERKKTHTTYQIAWVRSRLYQKHRLQNHNPSCLNT